MVVGLSGWGKVAWAAHVTCHLVYFRFTTRGAARRRRSGLRRGSKRRRKSSQPGLSRSSWSGGKAPGWARLWWVILSAVTKPTRSGSCPEWVAA